MPGIHGHEALEDRQRFIDMPAARELCTPPSWEAISSASPSPRKASAESRERFSKLSTATLNAGAAARRRRAVGALGVQGDGGTEGQGDG